MLKLDVDVDLATSKTFALLFFYEVEDGERRPIRMQQVYNHAVQSRKFPDRLPPNDQRLLKTLSPEISKPDVIRKNLLALEIPKRRWNDLRLRFAEIRDRFRDKESGASYAANLPKAKVYFELQCSGKQSLLSAVVDVPNGPNRPWCRVRENIRQTPQKNGEPKVEALIDGALVELDLPVDIALLNQYFGKDNPRVPSEAIAENLPALIDHRLDRLRGPSVERETRDTTARLELKSEGADVILRPMAGRKDLCLDKASAGAYLLRRGETFVVVESNCRHLDDLRRMVDELELRPDSQGRLVVPGSPEAISRLSQAVQRQPKELKVESPPELRSVLRKPLRLQTHVTAKESASWFELDLSCFVGDNQIDSRDIRRAASSPNPGAFRTRSGEWLQIDAADLQNAAAQIAACDGELSRRRPKFMASETLAALKSWPNLRLEQSAQELADELAHQAEAPPMNANPDLLERLRAYQRQGVEFLYHRLCYKVAPLLADDMGLGKTVQVLCTIDALRRAKRLKGPVLVACPASVVHVWRQEAEKFLPKLKVALLTGNPEQRARLLDEGADLFVGSYAVVRNDFEQLNALELGLVALDEAQYIKNPDAQVTAAVKSLRAPLRLALTGTPLENRLSDLWSIMDFLNPGYLGKRDEFEALHGVGSWHREILPKRIGPLMLRRTKGEVAPELPPRIEEVIVIPMADDQASFYRSELVEARKRVAGKQPLAIFAALTRLRQACCDPRLLDTADSVSSAKLACLLEMVEEVVGEGHSVLVFSQFTSMLDIIQEELDTLGVRQFMLTGETPAARRPKLVEAFNSCDTAAVFLLSLKAAGTGLTLSKADYVFLYDPWWNPAAENQAIDRTHRIGQDKAVMAYRLVLAESVEQKVVALQDEKRALFEQMIDNAEQADAKLGAAELAALLE